MTRTERNPRREASRHSLGLQHAKAEELCGRIMTDTDLQARIHNPETRFQTLYDLRRELQTLEAKYSTQLAKLLIKIVGRESLGGIQFTQFQTEAARAVFSMLDINRVDFEELFPDYLKEVAHQTADTPAQIDALLDVGIKIAAYIPQPLFEVSVEETEFTQTWYGIIGGELEKGFTKQERETILIKMNTAKSRMPKKLHPPIIED